MLRTWIFLNSTNIFCWCGPPSYLSVSEFIFKWIYRCGLPIQRPDSYAFRRRKPITTSIWCAVSPGLHGQSRLLHTLHCTFLVCRMALDKPGCFEILLSSGSPSSILSVLSNWVSVTVSYTSITNNVSWAMLLNQPLPEVNPLRQYNPFVFLTAGIKIQVRPVFIIVCSKV